MVDTVLRAVLEDCGIADMALCLYDLSAESPPDPRPLFVYHIAKAGGMSVHLALKSSLSLGRYAGDASQGYVRFQAHDVDLGQQAIRRPTVRAVTFEGAPEQATFGVHRAAGRDWRLMTVLRDPFDRVLSNYFHDIRRGHRAGPAGPDDFMAFARRSDLRDFQCKALSAVGAEPCDGEAAHDEALRNLETGVFVALTQTAQGVQPGLIAARQLVHRIAAENQLLRTVVIEQISDFLNVGGRVPAGGVTAAQQRALAQMHVGQRQHAATRPVECAAGIEHDRLARQRDGQRRAHIRALRRPSMRSGASFWAKPSSCTRAVNSFSGS